MADRKKKRAYLDDFEKDLNGNYQYRGAHYHYKGTKSRGRALAGLWVLCGGGAALVVAAGLVPGATAYAPFWLLLPYMASLLAAVYAVYLLVRLTAAGEPLRAYIQDVYKRQGKLGAVAHTPECLFGKLHIDAGGGAVLANIVEGRVRCV